MIGEQCNSVSSPLSMQSYGLFSLPEIPNYTDLLQGEYLYEIVEKAHELT